MTESLEVTKMASSLTVPIDEPSAQVTIHRTAQKYQQSTEDLEMSDYFCLQHGVGNGEGAQ